MAPMKSISKGKRTTADVHAAKARTSYPAQHSSSAFTSSKKDKRIMKHSILMSKIHDSGVRKQKRRRPGKEPGIGLESLGDALQDVVDDGKDDQSKVLQMKGVMGGRGQAKRREKLVKQERERFGQHLAALTTANGEQKHYENAPRGNRWAALRAHIQAATTNTSTG